MDDLTAFITARLDEDEAAHHHAGEGRIAWLTYLLDDGQLSHTTVAADHHDGYWHAGGKLLPEPASVLVVYDQAQALREVAAKRRILDDYRITVNACRMVTGPELDSRGYASMRGGRDAFRSACVSLAAVWPDHPDYKQEWAP